LSVVGKSAVALLLKCFNN